MKYEIWGIYPPPVGGVSVHLKRLITALNSFGNVVLKDFKPKKQYVVNYVKPVFNPYVEVISLLFSKKKTIHNEQFSCFVFLCLLIFGFRHKIGITIHNQRSLMIKSRIKMIVCKLFFRKCFFIIMNDKTFSERFARKFNVDFHKIHILPAYIPPSESERLGLPGCVLEFKKKHDFVLSANASKLTKDNGIDVYGADMLVDVVTRLKHDGINVGLLFLLPAVGDEVYYEIIRQKISVSGMEGDFLFVEGECENGFEYWEISDVFVRPTLTDMEGISIKEALSLGTTVVASDVCVRPNQCVLFRSRDNADLYSKIHEIYQSKKYKEKESYSEVINVAKATWEIYNSISG